MSEAMVAQYSAPASWPAKRAFFLPRANARDQLFTFVDAPDLVEPINNTCERALRPAFVNRKVTNGFRAEWAAQAKVAARTTVDTARLQDINPYAAIQQTLSA
jgi:transposase